MAIYTRYGSPVEIIHVDEDWNQEWVWIHREQDAEDEGVEVHISDLKADGGLAEIFVAVSALES